MSQREGFTLIELLVVIAILSILMAMLVPSLQHARELARLTACVSNLHHMGTALFIYAADHSEFPDYRFTGYDFNWWWSSTGISSYQTWLPRLVADGYLANEGLGYCSESDRTLYWSRMTGWFWRPNHDSGQNWGNYIYAGPGTHQRYWYGLEMSPRLTEVEYPGMWAWAGVHYDGRVMRCNGCPNHTVLKEWSNRVVPLMADSFLIRDWVSGLKTYPHFPNPDLYSLGDVEKGRGDVLFRDGSVSTYPHSY